MGKIFFEQKNFIILGMGYISSKHLQAIKAIGGNLIAYHDLHDVVGHVDKYFIDALYYPQFIHFDCFVDRFIRSGNHIDYAVILLPNHLHNPACRWTLNRGMDVICEKPLVLFEKNLDELSEVEAWSGHKVNTILQMRLHREAKRLYQNTHTTTQWTNGHSNVIIHYSTPRGHWFRHNGGWKSDPHRSGGLFTAIGVHLADLVTHVFGKYKYHQIRKSTESIVEGTMYLEHAKVDWYLSVAPEDKAQRVFDVDGERYDFTDGFTELHELSYNRILEGKGFGIEDARAGVRICEEVRKSCQSLTA